MRRETALAKLKEHSPELASEYGVESLSIFGSTARDEAGDSSDVDILVEFRETERVGLFRFLALKEALEGILGKPVDLVTPDALRSRLRDSIFKEAIRAA